MLMEEWLAQDDETCHQDVAHAVCIQTFSRIPDESVVNALTNFRVWLADSVTAIIYEPILETGVEQDERFQVVRG